MTIRTNVEIESLQDMQKIVAGMLVDTPSDSSEYLPTALLLQALLGPSESDAEVFQNAYKIASGVTPKCPCPICDSLHMRDDGYICEYRPEIFSWYLEAAEPFINPFWYMDKTSVMWLLVNRWSRSSPEEGKSILEDLMHVAYGNRLYPIADTRKKAEAIICGVKECGCVDCAPNKTAAEWFLKISAGCFSRDQYC